MRLERFRITAALLLLLTTLASLHATTFARADSPRIARLTISFDKDWRFFKGEAEGAERPEFDDAAWRKLDVPHDWSIEGPFDEGNATGKAGGYGPAGVGWYRKHFTLRAAERTRRVFVEFDGVMANSDVWVNGFHLGKRPYGYVGFRYELTGHLNFGPDKPNVIAVRADNSRQPASRWYAGAGVYRHVRLVTTDAVHLDYHGTFVSTPKVTKDVATVRVEGAVVNQSDEPRAVTLQVMLVGSDGVVVETAESAAQTVEPGQTVNFVREVTLKSPLLWNLDSPRLYTAVARVRAGGKTLDDEWVPFGVRDFKFEPETGFWLNGRNFKLKGVCLHHDASAFGAAVPLRAWERRLALLKTLGVNAIRTAHNPPAPEFLDLTDRMGFVVMDEMFDAWTVAKNPYDYHLFFEEWSLIDTRDTVRRDRNHPSVFLYSAGNEIHDTPKADLAKRILSSLVAEFHANDSTRPVTQALFRPNVSHDYDNGLADLLDVVGQNYRENEILAAHKQKPSRRIVGTENTHTREAWLALRDNPPYAGQFLWTGIDYLGESPGWPLVGFNFGLVERTGTVRPLGRQRQSWWSDAPMIFAVRRVAPTPLAPTDPGYGTDRRPQVLFGDWTPTKLDQHDENVEVYSNCEKVELFLNGRSLGAKPRPADDSPRTWKVPFEPGTLRAVGTNAGQLSNNVTHELKTAGRPARVLLSAERTQVANVWDDVVYVEATIVDANGVIVPAASDLVTFKVSGPGRVVAVDSGDNASHESFQASERRAFQGRCFALLKSDEPRGRITLTAGAAGLASDSVRLIAVGPPAFRVGGVQATQYHTR